MNAIRPLHRALLALTAALALAAPAQAHGPQASEASALSLAIPVAVSIAAPVMLLAGGAQLSVASVQATSDGAVWVLERASDGAQASLRFSGQAAGMLSVAAGTVVVASAVSAGWMLSAAGQVIAFVPNEIGRALLHNQRIAY